MDYASLPAVPLRLGTGPGPSSNTGPGPSSNTGPGPSSNTGPGPSSNTGPGPSSNTGPGPSSNSFGKQISFGPGGALVRSPGKTALLWGTPCQCPGNRKLSNNWPITGVWQKHFSCPNASIFLDFGYHWYSMPSLFKFLEENYTI